MSIAILTCPRCSTSLKTTKSVAAGSRFRCPNCGNAFAAPSGDAPAPSRRRARPPEDDEAPRGSGTWMILVGVIGVALLLLGGAAVALTLHFLPKKDAPAGPVAQTNGPGDPSQPANLPPPEPPWLPADKQDQVNAAIDRGVAYLEKTQLPGGTWAFNDQTGLAAFPGLTLLECGVPKDDPCVQNAARFVRGTAPNLNTPHTTYELALSILFLDQLGDPQDEPLIRTMALRLLAGQQPSGGWTYTCPNLSDKDEQQLWAVLEATRPRSSMDLIASPSGDKGIDGLITGRVGDGPNKPAVGSTIPLNGPPTDEEKQKVHDLYDGLPPNLKPIPDLKPPTADDKMPNGDNTDNSNTQFATLGLWAAGRHGVPMERALALLAQRFQITQTPVGHWIYQYHPHPGGEGEDRPSMTGAGLLGLAVGHGVTADLKGADVETAREDPRVEKGMKALGGYLNGRPADVHFPAGLYFLWSVERVGVLYGRRTIANKEWYPWGVDYLLKEQQGDGSWHSGGYYGATPTIDTCFALLFLKRANLAQDLSSKVEFLSVKKKDGD